MSIPHEWLEVSVDDALHLTLGSLKQQDQARNYLEKTRISHPAPALGILAVRLGVNPRNTLPFLSETPPAILCLALVEQGTEYTRAFCQVACRPQHRLRRNELGAFGAAVVTAMLKLDAPPPENVEYLRDWAMLIADNPVELFATRFTEHLHLALRLGIPATGALRAGWLNREDTLHAAWEGLNHAIKASDRKAWVLVLTDQLRITPQELTAFAPQIASLPGAEAPVVEKLILPLLPFHHLPEHAELALSALYSPTRKHQVAALNVLANAPSYEQLHPRVLELASINDPQINTAARRVLDSWGMDATEPEPKTNPTNLWQNTPPLWEVPRFDISHMTIEDLHHDWATITDPKNTRVGSLESERVLCFAHANKQAAHRVLVGTSTNLWPFSLVGWVQGTTYSPPEPSAYTYLDRDAGITAVLDQLPCLLSEPTWIDFRIDPRDLLSRLRRYHDESAIIYPADLLRALLRTDTTIVDAAELTQLIDTATTLPLTLTLPDGSRLDVGTLVAEYLRHPVSENLAAWKPNQHPAPLPLDSIPAFEPFIQFFGQPLYAELKHSWLPTFGDSLVHNLFWTTERHRTVVATALDCSRQKSPLGPRAAVNLLGVQRTTDPDLYQAVTDAWRRGLLIPGVADVAFLDEDDEELTHIPALVAALKELAEEGMLAVVWDVLDQLMGRAANAEVLPRGLIDAVDAIDYFLPATPDSARSLPGLHALAARKGKAKVLIRAKEVVEKLRRAASPG